MTNKQILKVGFDLDGVILYNPIRIFRPFASFFKFLKPYLFHQKTNNFYFPKSPFEQWLWKILHKTSFCPASGVKEIKKLVKRNKIEAYLITSRYSFLKEEFNYWLKKLEANKYFKGCFYNKDDLQPDEFKKLIIKKLRLDIFVEDNWGVIQKLNSSVPATKIFWISNILDRGITYSYKFPSLKKAVEGFFIKKTAENLAV